MITSCRSCGAPQLEPVLDLGEQHLSDFRDDDVRSPVFPLRLLRCTVCSLVQLSHTVDPDLLYHDRYSFKSGVSEAIRDDLADVVRDALDFQGLARRWLDIASNDGTLLSFVPKSVHREGIDPLPQFADEARQHADRITVDFFRPRYFSEKFDVITSVSMFYDLDDPNAFIAGVKLALDPRGVWVIQQNYLPTMLRQNSVDNVSHEHLTYYSLASLENLLNQHGLEVNDVTLHPVNGGCFRTVVSRVNTHLISPRVEQLRREEKLAEVDSPATWDEFERRTSFILRRLWGLVRGVNARGARVYVYGASTRGGTIWQAAGLDVRDLPFVVDRNPAKVGKVMSSIGAPIISEERARAERPDYMLVGPWWLKREFVEREREYIRSGGQLIFPLPNLEIVMG